MNIELRKAGRDDIKEIKRLLSFYALDTENVEKNLSEFILAVWDSKVVGCACLDIGDVIELRSIAILPAYRNKGIGSKLVDAILNRTAMIKDKVYLRTTSPLFFEKKGFIRLQNEEKKDIWKDCAVCDMFEICRQTMMRRDLKDYLNH